MEKASWRKGSRFTKIDPDLAYAEMESIREEEGHTADLLLDKARDGSNVLHLHLNGTTQKQGICIASNKRCR